MKSFTVIIIILVFNLFSCKSEGVSPDKAKIVSIKASSTLKHAKDIYKVNNLIDKDLNTIWAEGKNAYGKGETLTITFDKKVKLEGFFIQNGVNHKHYYTMNSRVKSLMVNGKQTVIIKDIGVDDFQWVNLKDAISTKVLILKIIDVYPGTKWKDTCITEIGFKGIDKSKFVKRKTQEVYTSGEAGRLTLISDGTFILNYNAGKLNGKYKKEPGSILLNVGGIVDKSDPGYPSMKSETFSGKKLTLIIDKNKLNKEIIASWSMIRYNIGTYHGLVEEKDHKILIKLFILDNKPNFIIPANSQFGQPLSLGALIDYRYIHKSFIFRK